MMYICLSPLNGSFKGDLEEELYFLNDQGTFVKVDNNEQDIQDKLRKAYNLALVVA